MSERPAWETYLEEHHDQHLEELFELLRIPSISALPDHRGDVRQAAEWVADALRKVGVPKVEIMETAGNPVVYGEWIVDLRERRTFAADMSLPGARACATGVRAATVAPATTFPSTTCVWAQVSPSRQPSGSFTTRHASTPPMTASPAIPATHPSGAGIIPRSTMSASGALRSSTAIIGVLVSGEPTIAACVSDASRAFASRLTSAVCS